MFRNVLTDWREFCIVVVDDKKLRSGVCLSNQSQSCVCLISFGGEVAGVCSRCSLTTLCDSEDHWYHPPPLPMLRTGTAR